MPDEKGLVFLVRPNGAKLWQVHVSKARKDGITLGNSRSRYHCQHLSPLVVAEIMRSTSYFCTLPLLVPCIVCAARAEL